MQKPIARSPERQRLSDAIERHREKADDLDRVERAIAKITDGRVENRVSISRARSAVEIARGAQSEILVARALGEELLDQPDLPAAQAVLDKAEADLDAGTSALRLLGDAALRAKSALGLAEMGLKRAVADAVAVDPKLASLRDEFSRTMATAARLARALHTAGVLGVNHIVELLGGGDPAWLSAISRLREDADAPLPDLPPDAPLDHARPGGRRAA